MQTALIISVLWCLYCAALLAVAQVCGINGKRPEEDVPGVEQ